MWGSAAGLAAASSPQGGWDNYVLADKTEGGAAQGKHIHDSSSYDIVQQL